MKYSSIFLNIILPIAAVMAMNILVFSLHWDSTPRNYNPWLNPPGELVGAVWVVLFLLMGVARYKVQKAKAPSSRHLARLIIYYMAFCLSYPLYTLGLKSYFMGLVGNAATFGFAAYLIFRISRVSKIAAWLLVPVLPWILYATLTMI